VKIAADSDAQADEILQGPLSESRATAFLPPRSFFSGMIFYAFRCTMTSWLGTTPFTLRKLSCSVTSESLLEKITMILIYRRINNESKTRSPRNRGKSCIIPFTKEKSCRTELL